MQATSAQTPAAPITGDESFDAPAPAPPAEQRKRARGVTPLQWFAASSIALLVIAGTVAFFAVDVCEEQLSDGGSAVTVCRNLDGTDPPVIGIGIVLLALLSVFFSEISGFGVTLKGRVEELEQKTDETRAEVAQNKQAARVAEEHAADVGREMLQLKREPVDLGEAPAAPEAPASPVRALADRYNEIRLTQPSGTQRTTAMTGVVTDMIAELRGVDDFDVRRHLESGDRGLRLAAYAYLYAYPDPNWTTALADSLIDREDKPFGQYWALRALRRQCETSSSALDANTRRRLEAELRPRFPAGTDRAVELAAVLRDCG